MKLVVGDRVKLNEEYIASYYAGGSPCLSERARKRRFKILAIWDEWQEHYLVKVKRLDLASHRNEIYWLGFLDKE